MNEFYSMYSFFYSAADPAMDGNVENTSPFLAIQTQDQSKEFERLRKLVNNARRSLLERARQLAESANDLSAASPAPPVSTSLETYVDTLLDDEFPVASAVRNTSRNSARWSTRKMIPIASGSRALRLEFGDKYEQVISGGLIQQVLPESPRLEAMIHLDPYQPPKAIFVELRTDKGSKRWVWATTRNGRSVSMHPQNKCWKVCHYPINGPS